MIQNPNNNDNGVLMVFNFNDGTRHASVYGAEKLFNRCEGEDANDYDRFLLRVMLSGVAGAYIEQEVVFPVVDCPEVTQ